MSFDQPGPSFQITHETTPSAHLVGGFSGFGLAGLTAVDYLVKQLELEETGHITTEALPAITPFSEGTPRHHTRLFSRSDLEMTVLVNEFFVPLWAADAFGKAILDWTDENGVEEITILSGVPVPHGPEEHRVFSIATEDYQSSRLTPVDIPPM
ncbi:MAG: PAC2 family protein, partial [Halobacteriales archaeon]|nr:PAC2 family protein [Halobacteriales archaeon]